MSAPTTAPEKKLSAEEKERLWKDADKIPPRERKRTSSWKTFLSIIILLLGGFSGLLIWAANQPGG